MEKRKPKIGLALGSGGAIGLTQIGVLKVIQENNIPIDYIAGVSVGSIVGAYYALCGEITGLERSIKRMSKQDMLKLIDIVSFSRGIEGKRVMDFWIGLIGDKNFSDLKIPLTVIATDLETGKETWFNKGSLRDAVRASIGIPGVFKPYKLNGTYFLDGGIVNPTPIDVVKKMGADIIIAVDHTTTKYDPIKNPGSIESLKRSYEIIRTQMTRMKMGNMDDKTVLISIEKRTLEDTYNFYNKRFILRGERIAKNYIPRIKKLIASYK